MNSKKIAIRHITKFVKNKLKNDNTGHDWWHIERVSRLAKYIAKNEKTSVNIFIVEVASLLHEMSDWKFLKDNNANGNKEIFRILKSFKIQRTDIEHIVDIVENLSFKGAYVASGMKTIEGKIVQDADRLDAIGAIGISRVFTYGGSKGVPIYDPSLKPHFHRTFLEYKTKKSTSINHFYEKLLLLINFMNTNTAKLLAHKRSEFMKIFLGRFFQEWGCKK